MQSKRRLRGKLDRRNLGRFSVLIPFWAPSSGFLRVARHSPEALNRRGKRW
jgi:hypothetical protein